MRIGLDVSSMQHFRWRDYAVRFVFGGIVTALAGLIATRYGPGVAGLFLAFPAIFPAGATLIEKQEREKKRSSSASGYELTTHLHPPLRLNLRISREGFWPWSKYPPTAMRILIHNSHVPLPGVQSTSARLLQTPLVLPAQGHGK